MGNFLRIFSFRERVLIFACLVIYFQDFQLTSQSLRMRSLGIVLYQVVWYGVAVATFTFIYISSCYSYTQLLFIYPAVTDRGALTLTCTVLT